MFKKRLMFAAIYSEMSLFVERLTNTGNSSVEYRIRTCDTDGNIIKTPVTQEEAYEQCTESLREAADFECTTSFYDDDFRKKYYEYAVLSQIDDRTTQDSYVYTVGGVQILAQENRFPNGKSIVSYFKRVFDPYEENDWQIITPDEWFDLSMQSNSVYCGMTQA